MSGPTEWSGDRLSLLAHSPPKVAGSLRGVVIPIELASRVHLRTLSKNVTLFPAKRGKIGLAGQIAIAGYPAVCSGHAHRLSQSDHHPNGFGKFPRRFSGGDAAIKGSVP